MCRLGWNLRRGWEKDWEYMLDRNMSFSHVFLRDLVPNMGDQIMARYTDRMTDESDYPTSGGERNKLVKENKRNRMVFTIIVLARSSD